MHVVPSTVDNQPAFDVDGKLYSRLLYDQGLTRENILDNGVQSVTSAPIRGS